MVAARHVEARWEDKLVSEQSQDHLNCRRKRVRGTSKDFEKTSMSHLERKGSAIDEISVEEVRSRLARLAVDGEDVQQVIKLAVRVAANREGTLGGAAQFEAVGERQQQRRHLIHDHDGVPVEHDDKLRMGGHVASMVSTWWAHFRWIIFCWRNRSTMACTKSSVTSPSRQGPS